MSARQSIVLILNMHLQINQESTAGRANTLQFGSFQCGCSEKSRSSTFVCVQQFAWSSDRVLALLWHTRGNGWMLHTKLALELLHMTSQTRTFRRPLVVWAIGTLCAVYMTFRKISCNRNVWETNYWQAQSSSFHFWCLQWLLISDRPVHAAAPSALTYRKRCQ